MGRRRCGELIAAVLAPLLGVGASPAIAQRSAGGQRVRASIVGGTAAAAGTFPWMAYVRLVTSTDGGTVCGGTVVASNVVLTAAHCLVDATSGAPHAPSQYTVSTGSVTWYDESRATISDVSRTIVYPGYDRATNLGDAGLIVLTAPVHAPAVALGPTSAGAAALMAGWGTTGDGADEPDGLRSAPTVVQAPDYCALHVDGFDAGSELCTADPPDYSTAVCHGDSGGPLLVADAQGRLVEVGIIGYGPANCDPHFPDVYASVQPLDAWIAGQIAAVRPPAAPPPLPQLGLPVARRFARQALARSFKDRRRLTVSCRKRNRTQVDCRVSWRSRSGEYSGSVRVAYLRVRGHVRWSGHYDIRWAPRVCAARAHRGRGCAVHRRRGTVQAAV